MNFALVEGQQPDFHETDAETSEDSSLRATGSESEVLVATDDDKEAVHKQPYAKRRQERLQFFDKTVCSKSCARLLGIGQTTLQRLREGQAVFTMKNRQPIPKHPSFEFSLRGEAGSKWTHVVLFLWPIYHSSAECLPTDFVSGFKQRQSEGSQPQDQECMFPKDSNCDREDVLRSVNSFLRSLHQYNSDVEAHMIGPGFFRGERRHLPHGTRTEMFFEYRAYCKSVGDNDPASFATFLRIANKVFGPHMRAGFLNFRKPGEHAVCDVCTRLKRSMRFRRGVLAATGGPTADADAVQAYSSHILHQWLD